MENTDQKKLHIWTPFTQCNFRSAENCNIVSNERVSRDHSFSAFAKFSGKLTFLTPLLTFLKVDFQSHFSSKMRRNFARNELWRCELNILREKNISPKW